MTTNSLDRYFQESILKWGKQNLRTFPWRDSRNPYHFLIVEILLQKTKAEQVVEFYNKFIAKYPHIQSLAKSNIEELKELIKPLGLFYRADRLKETANLIINDFEGIIPNNEKDLISLKGIGKYVAKAILCFGFNEPISILDVNIGRIFIRFFGLDESKRIRDSKELWKRADMLLPKNNYRNYNLYLLDFGSLICQKRKPKCKKCPLSYHCSFLKKEVK